MPLSAHALGFADRQGEVHDVVHCHKPSAIDGALVSSRDKGYWPEGCQAVEGDDVIHFLPKLVGPPVEVGEKMAVP